MNLCLQYEHDRNLWDTCAAAYENAIVQGHPDVTAYEHFEEDLLDRILLYLIRDCRHDVHLYDVGCGSGRLHLRYGLKSFEHNGDHPSSAIAAYHQSSHNEFQFSPWLASGLKRVGGLDFSGEMLALAARKLDAAGLGPFLKERFYFEQGSAFDLEPFPGKPLPLVVTLCNSIGVMQGPEGAREVFRAMRRAVEQAGGIALISAYRREAVRDYALGNYESTLEASGQPVWLRPDTYARPCYQQQPRMYKRAYSPSDRLEVDVYTVEGGLEHRGFHLQRDPEATRKAITTGHIQTHTGYESYWYSFAQFEAWIKEFWPSNRSWHLVGSALDKLRAAPAQLAILDTENKLEFFFERLGIQRISA